MEMQILIRVNEVEASEEHDRAESLGTQRNAFAGSVAEFLARFGYDQPWMWEYVERPDETAAANSRRRRARLLDPDRNIFDRLAQDVKGIL